jgi:hypothetical protein
MQNNPRIHENIKQKGSVQLSAWHAYELISERERETERREEKEKRKNRSLTPYQARSRFVKEEQGGA